MEIKYETLKMDIKENPTFIIGQCPGKTSRIELKKQEGKYFVFKGNRTGRFVQSILDGMKNLYLTNIFNYYIDFKINKEIINKGLQELQEDVFNYKPKKIVCLGKFAQKYIKQLQLPKDCIINIIEHPAHALRFKYDGKEYVKKFKSLL